LTRTVAFAAVKAWRLRLAKSSGFKKARVADANTRKLRRVDRGENSEPGVYVEPWS
jgi:hypothetical protein